MTTLLALVYYLCRDGEGGGGVPRVAGGQRARRPWSGAAGNVSEGRRDPQDAPSKCFVLSVERSLSRAWSGGEGSEGPGGGGKRYKEKAKLFPRHFLHLH